MNLLCGLVQNLWNTVYNKCVRNLDDATKVRIGVILLIASMILFIMCSKGPNKAHLVNNWFLFWLALITFVMAVMYLSVFR